MGRTGIALAWAFAAALVVADSACGHKECDDALKICRADFGNRIQAPPTQMLSMGGLKTALARLHAKVPWPTEVAGDPSGGAMRKIDRGKAGQLEKKHSKAAKQTVGARST